MKIMLAASPGGHLDQVYEFARRWFPSASERVWVTARTAQSQSLLDGEQVEWTPQVGSRQGLRAARSLPRAVQVVRRQRPDVFVSTGAALAFPYLLAARLQGVRSHYIDSATRVSGPSVTGRLAELVPGTRLHHQSARWPRRRWSPAGNVFDGYTVEDVSPRPLRRVVVTLGSERFPFHRAVHAAAASIPDDVEVVWQLGHTPVADDLPGEVHRWIPYEDLLEEVTRADAVITHAGVGSILMALRAGLVPVVMPRVAAAGEHIDDHQLELTERLAEAELVMMPSPASSDLRPLLKAASGRLVRAQSYEAA